MEKLTQILKELEQGKISSDNAESKVLRLFSVSNAKRTFCPRCNSDKVSKDEYAPYPLYYCDSCFNKWAI